MGVIQVWCAAACLGHAGDVRPSLRHHGTFKRAFICASDRRATIGVVTATGWAVLCYCVGLVADTVGLFALIKAGFDAKQAILAIEVAPGLTHNEADGTYTMNDRDAEVRTALGNQKIIWWSIAALVLGIMTGFAGNMISSLATSK
jgi:hypothetical protein